jgi:hypothetical protein
VGIWEQAKYPHTPLGQFLDDRLPHRDAIVEPWTTALDAASGDGPVLRGGYDTVGWALELRLGLDLASNPPRRQELSYLPIHRCTHLLTASGFEHIAVGALPDGGTRDPILLHWSRTHHPVGIDHVQRAALMACLDLGSFRGPMHDWGKSKSVEERRALFAMVGDKRRSWTPDMLDAFAYYWTAYLARGRSCLTSLGDRAIVAPELGNGFGVADLVVGHTLVDVKLVAEHTVIDVQAWLRQLLGYVLLDHHDALHLNAIAVYSGQNAQLLTYPLPQLIAAASPGPTPDLATLRTEFRQSLRNDLDGYTAWKQRERYR